MNGSIVKLSFLLGLGFIFSYCKKDKIDSIGGDLTSPDTAEKRSYFTDTLQTQVEQYSELFAGYSPKGQYFYLIQRMSYNNYYRVTKCNMNADTLYSKIINLGPNRLIQIKGGINEDCFYTVTASRNFGTSFIQSIGAYTLTSSQVDTTCPSVYPSTQYIFGSDVYYINESTPINTCELKKYDAKANQIWTKYFSGNHFNGNALEISKKEELYLLTAERYPYRMRLNTQYSGIFPYYDVVLDSNRFTLHKLSQKGQILEKKEIHNVFQEYGLWFNPQLVLTSEHIWVYNSNNLYMFNLGLKLLYQKKPIRDVCFNKIHSMVANINISSAKLTGFLGYSEFLKNRYFLSLRGISEEHIHQYLNTVPLLFAFDRFQNSYSFETTNTLKKFNFSGEELYSISGNSGFTSNMVYSRKFILGQNDKLYCFALENNLIKVYKLDENGNF